MRIVLAVLFGTVMVALLVLPFPSQMARGIHVPVHVPGLESTLAQRLTAIDWGAELRAADPKLTAEQIEAIVKGIEDAEVVAMAGGVRLQVTVQTKSSALHNPVTRMLAVLGVVEHRLRLEEGMLCYDSLDAEGRRSILWNAYGSGFDGTVGPWLKGVTETETDEGVREFARGLSERLSR